MTFLSIIYCHNHNLWKEEIDPRSQDFVTSQVPETSDNAHPSGRSNRSSIITPAEPDVELVVPLNGDCERTVNHQGLLVTGDVCLEQFLIVGIDDSRVSIYVESVLRCNMMVDLVRRDFLVIANLGFLEHGRRNIANLQTMRYLNLRVSSVLLLMVILF